MSRSRWGTDPGRWPQLRPLHSGTHRTGKWLLPPPLMLPHATRAPVAVARSRWAPQSSTATGIRNRGARWNKMNTRGYGTAASVGVRCEWLRRCGTSSRQLHVQSHVGLSENVCQATADSVLLLSVFLLYFLSVCVTSNDRMTGEPSIIRDLEGIGGDLIEVLRHCYLKEVDETRQRLRRNSRYSCGIRTGRLSNILLPHQPRWSTY